MKIPLNKIVVSKNNPRQTFDEEKLRRLGENILEYGQLQNILVRPKGSMFELIIGERRLRAMALLGIPEIEADVRELDDASCVELRLIENCHREDLTHAEKGDAILSLWADFDKYKTIKEVAEALDIPYDSVKIWVRKSRKLSDKVKRSVELDTISEDHTHELLSFSPKIQNKLVDVILKYKIPNEKFRIFTKELKENPKIGLDKLAKEIMGIKIVKIQESMLTVEQKAELSRLEVEKELAKQRQTLGTKSPPRAYLTIYEVNYHGLILEL